MLRYCDTCGRDMAKLGLDPRFKKWCSETCRVVGYKRKIERERVLQEYKKGFDFEEWKKDHKPIIDARGEIWVQL